MATLEEPAPNPLTGLSLFPPAPARVDVSGFDLTRTKTGDTRESAEPGPEMLAATQQRRDALTDTLAVADKKFGYDAATAGIKAEEANQGVGVLDTVAKGKAAAEKQYAPDIELLSGEVKKAHQQFQAYESPALFANRTSWEKVLLGVGLAMGAFGGVLEKRAARRMGVQSSIDPVGDIIRMDLDRQRATLGKLSDNELRAKSGLKDRRDALAVELAKVEARGSEMYKRVAAVATARLQALGVDAAGIERDTTVAKARQDAAAAETAAASGLVRRVTEHDESVSRQSTQRTTINTPSPDAMKKGEVKPSGTDIDSAAMLDKGAENLGRLGEIVTKNPEAFQSVQKAMREQEQADKLDSANVLGVGGKQVRALGQAFGVVDTRVEQKLKTPEERAIYQGIQQHATQKAKAYGGTMTESDVQRATAEQNLWGGPQEYAATVARDAAALQAQRQNYTDLRKIPAPAAPKTATPSAPAAPQMVPISPTPEHPTGGVGIINSDGTRSIRWNP